MKLVSIAIFSLLIAACGSDSKSVPPSAQPSATSPRSETSRAEQRVTIDSADGVRIVGSYYAASKPSTPAILLLHQWQSDRHSYDEFAKRMQSKGFNVLSIDGRGFGESTEKPDGTTLAAGRTDADVKAMLGDVAAAVDFLKKQKDVDATKIGIVGASYGSSLAIIYAAEHPDIKAVALLSPGLDYFGNMPTRPAVEKYSDRDLFMAAAKDDAESAKAVADLSAIKSKYESLVIPAGTYHGTHLFDYRERPGSPAVVEDALVSFFTNKLVVNAERR